jgi:hypothetical protein
MGAERSAFDGWESAGLGTTAKLDAVIAAGAAKGVK